jgi:acetylornithine deacetylase/succinyl-diaminopimelate desuccinylase-like protein
LTQGDRGRIYVNDVRHGLLSASLLSALALAHCATTLPPPDGPLPAEIAAVARAIDWPSAGKEAAQVLSGYLRTETINPPGNETLGAVYLEKILANEGIASQILEFAPNRGSLIARVRGSGREPPLCLLSHIDVVPAEPAHWPKDRQPFSGVVDEQGVVWGRGALDMKGMGVAELMTLIWLHRKHVPLTRDVILLAVADEEVGSGGILDLVAHHWGELGCTELVNEGGIGIRDLLFEGQTVFSISTGEKGLLWLRVIAHGKSGHGSTPKPDQAPDRLLRALIGIQKRQAVPSFHPAFFELFASVGEQKGGLAGFILKRPVLVRMLLKRSLMENPLTRAAMTNTVNLTGLEGSISPNVIPSESVAVFDCRLLPGVKPEEVLAEIKELVGDDPSITYEVVSQQEANESPRDDRFYRALARYAVEGRSDAAAGPVISVGYTDSLHVRPLGVHAYGFVPFAVTREEAATMHGDGERVSTENLERAIRVLFSSIVEVAFDRR